MKNIKISVFTLLILVSYFYLGGQVSDLSQTTRDIKQIVKNLSKGLLNKNSLIRQLGENIKIYYYNPDAVDQNRKEDSGSLFIQKGEYLICLNYKGDKKKRDCGFPPVSLIFKNNNGFPISMLVEIFGKWTYYSNEKRMLTKYPRFSFARKIDDKFKIDVIASEIYGPFDNPMQCVCLNFSLSIEKR